jgi:hypothetical protein
MSAVSDECEESCVSAARVRDVHRVHRAHRVRCVQRVENARVRVRRVQCVALRASHDRGRIGDRGAFERV